MKKLILFAVLSLFLIKGHATDQFVFFQKETGYFINDTCIRCLKCLDVCPQKCVHVDQKVKIDQRHCLSCGRCLEICPVRAIEREI